MVTLADTFSDFFGSDNDTDYSLCPDCGKPHNNGHYLYTTDDGDAVWICNECDAKREIESQKRIEASRRSVMEWDARDAWEE